jgi:hypothetical protein
MKNSYINHFNNILHINDLKHYDNQTILSSIFTYYNGSYNIIHDVSNKSFRTSLTKNFTNLLHAKKIYIIDYANVIHILYNHYRNINNVISTFYTFIHKHLLLNETIFIICKNVTLPGVHFNFNIQSVFNIGKKITSLVIDEKYFNEEKLNVYNLQYKNNNRISSSSDDLLGHFICFNIFVYLFKNNKKPENKIVMMTNDKQYLNKNLFGITNDETKYHIHFQNDIIIKKLGIINNDYMLSHDIIDEVFIVNFFKEYITTNQNDTKDIECIIVSLIELLLNNNRKNKIYTGKFIACQNINKNFTRKKFIKKTTIFTYNHLNKLFVKTTRENATNKTKNTNDHIHCILNNIKQISYYNGDLKKSFYLYAYIKYIQSFLHKNKIMYDFYGNIERNEIIQLFHNK